MLGGMVALKPFFSFLKNIYRSFCLSFFMKIREILIFPTRLSNELYQLRSASLVPRAVRAIRVTGGGAEDDWERGWRSSLKILSFQFYSPLQP